MRNRVYHPLLGCWLQRDPIGYAGGTNLYEYAIGKILTHTDPSGERFVGDTDKCPIAMGNYRRCLHRIHALYTACMGKAFGPTLGVEVPCAALCRWLGKSVRYFVCFSSCSILGLGNFLCNKTVCDAALSDNEDICGNELNQQCFKEGGVEPWCPDR